MENSEELKITLGDDTQWFDDLTVNVNSKVLNQLFALGNKESIFISPAKTTVKVTRIKLQSNTNTYTGLLDYEATLDTGHEAYFPAYSIKIQPNEVHN